MQRLYYKYIYFIFRTFIFKLIFTIFNNGVKSKDIIFLFLITHAVEVNFNKKNLP